MNREELLKMAVALAVREGYGSITRHALVKVSGVSYGTCFNWLGDMEATKTAVMTHAVENSILSVVADGLANRHPVAKSAPLELRQAAVASLV